MLACIDSVISIDPLEPPRDAHAQEEFFRVMRKRGNAPLDDIDSDDDF